MKEIYERPMMMIELFTIQQAIAACSEGDVVFDCMLGGQRDTTNVIVSGSCDNEALYNSVKTAYHPNSNNHSNYTGGSWTSSSSGGTIYTAPSGAVGLLAICAVESTTGFGPNQTTYSYSNNEWELNGSTLQHSSGTHLATNGVHCQIAPVYNYDTMNTGS